ncbi:hypothetical protein [Staphylococcus lugdunensis]|uniref:hypothetical protein n=1 Tax=Staphylococcus lugdunensis TaxID=28035 RepID=UPI000A0FA3D3|nr:hypothetical protein [Staphylococcus lugdunensis]ARJ26153.1 hypothetical protein B7469_00190 [Staphylococcus lugdunensis]MCH8673538.1 hypothetical protein [Staphylococcus lugdunensis]MCH8675368.1 hypothetical protein [Staphylococcus lugdunensis]MCI2752545.1 hypothetical protein [Staphylococcus lugdunensis]MCI2762495.1 hypothetical protein [Staphylococcus lugdunensis]
MNNNIVGDIKLLENNKGTALRANWEKCAELGGGIANGVGYGAIGATPVSVGTGSAIGVVSGEMGEAASCFD